MDRDAADHVGLGAAEQAVLIVVSFEALRAEILAAQLDPRWAAEVEIVRDEPERLLIRFVRVSERGARPARGGGPIATPAMAQLP